MECWLRPAVTLLACLWAGSLAAQAIAPWQFVPLVPVPASTSNSIRNIQLPTTTDTWVMASGNSGLGSGTSSVYYSANEGQTWQQRAYYNYYSTPGIDAGNSLLSISALPTQQAWLLELQYAVPKVYLLSLVQGSPTGITVSSSTAISSVQGAPASIRFFSATTGLLLTQSVGASPTTFYTYRTTNAGQTWTQVLSSSSIDWLPTLPIGNHFWMASAAGIHHTSDAGQTWTVAAPPTPLAQLAFRDAQHGLACGDANNQHLYRTSDGGTTWTLVAPAGPWHHQGLRAVAGSPGTYLSFGTARYTGDADGSAISYDEGQTWQALESITQLYTAATGPGNRIWGGYSGIINSGSTMLARLAGTALAVAPPAAGLAPTLYPNPTAGPVQLPAAGAYRQVQVYDATGRLCRTAPLGPSETSLDLAPYGPGLYVLRLGGGPAAPLTQRLCVRP